VRSAQVLLGILLKKKRVPFIWLTKVFWLIGGLLQYYLIREVLPELLSAI
jgi:hypothetical protein